MFADPQIAARAMRVTIPHGAGVAVDHPANPVKFSETPVDYPRAAPLLGADAADILRDWLALDAAALDALREDGVV